MRDAFSARLLCAELRDTRLPLTHDRSLRACSPRLLLRTHSFIHVLIFAHSEDELRESRKIRENAETPRAAGMCVFNCFCGRFVHVYVYVRLSSVPWCALQHSSVLLIPITPVSHFVRISRARNCPHLADTTELETLRWSLAQRTHELNDLRERFTMLQTEVCAAVEYVALDDARDDFCSARFHRSMILLASLLTLHLLAPLLAPVHTQRVRLHLSSQSFPTTD